MAEPLINNSVYLKNHITERKIVEKGKLKTTNLSGDEVQETGKIKRKEDLDIQVGERPVRRERDTLSEATVTLRTVVTFVTWNRVSSLESVL